MIGNRTGQQSKKSKEAQRYQIVQCRTHWNMAAVSVDL